MTRRSLCLREVDPKAAGRATRCVRPRVGVGSLEPTGRSRSEPVHANRPDSRRRRGICNCARFVRRRVERPRDDRSRPSRRHAQAARQVGLGHDRPAGQLHASVLAALPGELRRAARLQEGGRERRVPGCPRHRPEHPDADERREALGVQDPQGDQVLERPAGHAERRRGLIPSHLQGQEPHVGNVLRRHRRRAGVPRPSGDLHAERRRDRQRQGRHGDDQPRRTRPGVQVPPLRAARKHPPGEHAAERRGDEAHPRHGHLLLHLVPAEQAADPEAEPLLQAVVGRRAAGGLRRRDRLLVRPDRRGADHRDRERPGGLDTSRRLRPIGSTSSGRSTRTRCT